MHQKDKEGGGQSLDNYYESWMMLVCPVCGREVREFYSATVVKKGGEHG